MDYLSMFNVIRKGCKLFEVGENGIWYYNRGGNMRYIFNFQIEAEYKNKTLLIFNAVVAMLKKKKKYEGVTFYFWALKGGDYLEVRYETHFGYDYKKIYWADVEQAVGEVESN